MFASPCRRLLAAFIVLAPLHAAGSLHSQGPQLPLIGTRVRVVTSSGEPHIGSVVEVSRRSFSIAISEGDGAASLLLVDRRQVRRVDQSLGVRSRAGHGAKLGASIGLALGLAAALLVGNDDTGTFQSTSFLAYTGIVLVPVAAGGLIGGGIGSLSHGEGWRKLAIP